LPIDLLQWVGGRRQISYAARNAKKPFDKCCRAIVIDDLHQAPILNEESDRVTLEVEARRGHTGILEQRSHHLRERPPLFRRH
jgi:hypothetical protein